MVEAAYTQTIVEIAKNRLETMQKPLSKKELCRNIVSVLKKKVGKDDARHSSKLRFAKDILPDVLKDPIWQNSIVYSQEKKFDLSSRVSVTPSLQAENSQMELDEAIDKLVCILKNIHPLKLEEIVSVLIEKKFGYKASLTKRNNDEGIDIIATKDDDMQYAEKNKKMVIFAQVKRYSKNVGRVYCDQFIGALNEHRQNKQWSKFTCIFITTSDFPLSFRNKLRASEPERATYLCWNGRQLAQYLIECGIGTNYSFDYEFWEKQKQEV